MLKCPVNLKSISDEWLIFGITCLDSTNSGCKSCHGFALFDTYLANNGMRPSVVDLMLQTDFQLLAELADCSFISFASFEIVG